MSTAAMPDSSACLSAPSPRMDLPAALANISMVAANFGNAETFEDILEDWFKFLGGRPGEVCIVDGGSNRQTQDLYWKLFQQGKIDKLQIIRPEHPENHKDRCFYQEHAAGAIAGRPYLLWFKSDTLPRRTGHDDWVPQALEFLDRPDTFAVGGSFNVPSRHHDAPWPGWYFSDKCSENFSLMKRASFIAAMQEFAGDYIASGFRGPSPADTTNQRRFLVEVAFENYIRSHQQYTLVKVEDPTWMVFHTNVLGKDLVGVRQDFLAGKDVEKYFNAGSYNRMWTGSYYGKPPQRWKNFKWMINESSLGPVVRGIKRLLGLKLAPPPASRYSRYSRPA